MRISSLSRMEEVSQISAGLGEDCADTGILQSQRRLLARGATAEVAARDQHVAGPDLLAEARVKVLHAVVGKVLKVQRFGVLARDDQIGVDAVAVNECLAHRAMTSLGSVMTPASAETAAVAGDAK